MQLYVNDLPDEVTGLIQLFADDMKIYRGIGTGFGHDRLQADLDRLAAWSDKWIMPSNVAKCSTLRDLGTEEPQAGFLYSGITSASDKC